MKKLKKVRKKKAGDFASLVSAANDFIRRNAPSSLVGFADVFI